MDFRVVFSTAADQTAVSRRECSSASGPTRAGATSTTPWSTRSGRAWRFSSARYSVARDTWNGVSSRSITTRSIPGTFASMLATAKQALDYFSREFAPYPLSSFRILEYPRYRTAARPIQARRLLGERRLPHRPEWLDVARLRDDSRARPPVVGRPRLRREHAGPSDAQRDDGAVLDADVVQAGSGPAVAAPRPGSHTPELSRCPQPGERRGAAADATPRIRATSPTTRVRSSMFALQDLIGADRMHEGLRRFLRRFAMQPPPYPMSRDLVDELRAVAGPEYQQLITDMFERIVLYDVSPTSVDVTAVDGEYEVAVEHLGAPVRSRRTRRGTRSATRHRVRPGGVPRVTCRTGDANAALSAQAPSAERHAAYCRPRADEAGAQSASIRST